MSGRGAALGYPTPARKVRVTIATHRGDGTAAADLAAATAAGLATANALAPYGDLFTVVFGTTACRRKKRAGKRDNDELPESRPLRAWGTTLP